MEFNSSKFNQQWNSLDLNSLGVFQRGKSRHRPRNDNSLFVNGKYPFIQTGEIKEAHLYIKKHEAAYNEKGLAQSKLWDKNTLCITIAANIAETALLGYPMCFPDSVVGFNAYPEKSSEVFMHYIFTYIKKSIQNTATGSIQDNINIDFLTNLTFKIPHKKFQDKIAAVLSSLDAKIDCNNRINAQLEALAKALYDYWFVQFDFPDTQGRPYKSSGGKMVYNEVLKREIPEGWRDGTLSELGTIVGGSTPSTENLGNFCVSGTPWITPNDLSNNQGNKFITRGNLDVSEQGLKNASLKKYPAGTVLLSSRAPIGYMAIARGELTTNQGFKSFIPNKKHPAEYIYYTVHSALPDIINKGTGSTFKEVSAAVLKTVKISLPPVKVSEGFKMSVDTIFRRQDFLEQENQHLAHLRDWLLPMLMNGQVSVL